MEELEIGRLIRSLSEPCPECKSKGLQLRVKDETHLIDGENVIQKHEYHYCNRCEYLVEIKNKKFSRKREWKPIEIIPEPEPVKKWIKKTFDKNNDKKDSYSKPKFPKKG